MAQQDSSVNPTTTTNKEQQAGKKLTIGTLLVTDYTVSLTNDVDFNGKHNAGGVKANDGFFLRYVRVSGNYAINDRISAGILVNLAEFKSDPKNKVLENAFVRYKFNNYAAVTMGQFRPFFGLEDMYPFDFNKSYVWSNQYNLFGANGWQSFQLGAAFTGSLRDRKIPLNYYLSVVNGNGKNQPCDNDKSKNVMLRVDYDILPKVKVGVNGGWSGYDSQPASAYGADLQAEIPLNNKMDIIMDAEFKTGTNFIAYAADTASGKRLADYNMSGVYFTPAIRYNINRKNLKSLEFSMRQEYLDAVVKNNNTRSTATPMLTLNLAEKYAAKACFGVAIDQYKHQIANTTTWNANSFFIQVQFKY